MLVSREFLKKMRDTHEGEYAPIPDTLAKAECQGCGAMVTERWIAAGFNFCGPCLGKVGPFDDWWEQNTHHVFQLTKEDAKKVWNAAIEEYKKAANLLIDYCEAHNWGTMPQ